MLARGLSVEILGYVSTAYERTLKIGFIFLNENSHLISLYIENMKYGYYEGLFLATGVPNCQKVTMRFLKT